MPLQCCCAKTTTAGSCLITAGLSIADSGVFLYNHTRSIGNYDAPPDRPFSLMCISVFHLQTKPILQEADEGVTLSWSYCGYLSLMHFSFICRHDPVLAAAEVALHVEKEVNAAGKLILQCSKHPNQMLHAHTVAPLLLSRSNHCMQSSMRSQNFKCAFFNSPLPLYNLTYPSMLSCYHCCTSQQHVWMRQVTW